MSNRITARARVNVEVEIVVSDTWGHDCTVSQIRDQATNAAVSTLSQLERDSKGKIRLTGKPRVTMIVTAEEP